MIVRVLKLIIITCFTYKDFYNRIIEVNLYCKFVMTRHLYDIIYLKHLHKSIITL